MSQESKVYSFKGVGQTVSDHEKSLGDPEAGVPFGIATPVRLAKKAGTFVEMHVDPAQQIRDNFKNMVATNHGERLMLFDFGANLRPLAFELGAEDADTEAIRRITSTTAKYMPYVSLETFEPIRQLSNDGSLARVGVRVVYSVPNLGITGQVIEALIMSAG